MLYVSFTVLSANELFSIVRLNQQLISLQKQPSMERRAKDLKRELVQKNFARADRIKELTVRFRYSVDSLSQTR